MGSAACAYYINEYGIEAIKIMGKLIKVAAIGAKNIGVGIKVGCWDYTCGPLVDYGLKNQQLSFGLTCIFGGARGICNETINKDLNTRSNVAINLYGITAAMGALLVATHFDLLNKILHVTDCCKQKLSHKN